MRELIAEKNGNSSKSTPYAQSNQITAFKFGLKFEIVSEISEFSETRPNLKFMLINQISEQTRQTNNYRIFVS